MIGRRAAVGGLLVSTGLMAGAVFGKIAGDSAAKKAAPRLEAKASGRNW